jgi:hypothetical protein
VTTTSSLHTELGQIDRDPAYQQLAKLWATPSTQPTDKTLLAAWNAIREIAKEKPIELDAKLASVSKRIQALSGSNPTVTVIANVAAELTGHLEAFKAKVIDAAKAQQAEVASVDKAANGRPETVTALELIANLEVCRAGAVKEATAADQPLKYSMPHGSVGSKVQTLATKLDELGRHIDALVDSSELSDDAVQEMILKPVREGLKKASDDMSQPQADMGEVWQRLNLGFGENRRLVRIGRRLSRLEAIAKEQPDIIDHLKEAFRRLIGHDLLAAEIELERAESKIHYLLVPGAIVKDWKASLGERRDQWKGDLEKLLSPLSKGWKTIADGIKDRIPNIQFPTPWLSLPLLEMWDPSDAINSVLSFIATILGILLAAIVVLLFVALLPLMIVAATIVLVVRVLGILLNELWENAGPAFVSLLLGISSQLLTIAVAVALIIWVRDLVGKADTWGSFFDFATAFAWGVLANRTAQPLQSGWAKLVELLEPKETQSVETASTKGDAEQGSESQ